MSSMSSLVFLLFIIAVTHIESSFLQNFGGLGLGRLGFLPGQYCFGENTKNSGSCATYEDCKAKGYVVDGNCSLINTGVCCLATHRCDAQATTNNSYFASADYPSGTNHGSSSCTMKTTLLFNTMYVRVDFIEFEISPPSTEGKCNGDYLLIEGARQEVPKICGINSGQHLYLPVDPLGTLTLNIVLSGRNFPRKWLIKVIQLDSLSPSLPPTGCAQYYSDMDGEVNSFNYDVHNKVGRGTLSNVNYRICFANHVGFCKVKLTTQYFDMGSSHRSRQRRQEEELNELMRQEEEFNRLHGSTSTAATEEIQTDEIDTDEPATDSPVTQTETDFGFIQNSCEHHDTLYFSRIKRTSILPVFCGKLRFTINLDEEPYYIRVRNAGSGRGKGFSLKYKYTIC